MRMALWLLAAVVALATAGTASAGCWATVGLSPLPSVAAGETWTANVQVLQHGRTPMDDASPAVLISNGKTGEQRSFPAALVDPAEGLYEAAVVFPSGGSWSVAVNDGFPEAPCAATHTFGTFAIAAGSPPAEPPGDAAAPEPVAAVPAAASAEEDGSSLALPLGLGLGLAGLLVGGAFALRARQGRTARPA